MKLKLRKIGIILTSTALSFSLFSSVASGQTFENGHPERLQIQVASTATESVSKSELIKKFKQLFPGKFDFLTESDFTMNSGIYYPENELIRYDLNFNKTVNGKMVYGYVGFVGEDLQIESFYYEPPNQADALFPPTVSKEEAEKIALNLVKKLPDGQAYKLDTNSINYYSNQILTEPVRYSFSFVQTKNNVPIVDRRVEVMVLGNGEVVNFYKMVGNTAKSTFDEVTQVQNEKDILSKVKENLSLSLQYQIEYDYKSNERKVNLVYTPLTKVQGVHATTGNWQTVNGFVKEVPGKSKVEKITNSQLAPRQKGITVEQAKKVAEDLLKVNSDQVKLMIHSINEMENYNGQQIISIQYSYEFKRGGYGASLEIDKNTGEILQYHDIKREVLREVGEVSDKEKEITQDEALAKAITYLKQWVPSYLYNYAKPIDDPYVDEYQGAYYFTFPRIVNGITVSGDEISVAVAKDGALSYLYVNHQEVKEWPSINKVIGDKKAVEIMKEDLSVKLTYMQQVNEQENHYYLVYTPYYEGNLYNHIDALTGEWLYVSNDSITPPVIEHPTAEEELNYLMDAGILEVKDIQSFNADASITRGEALKMIVKSLTYFYEGPYLDTEIAAQSFENIDSTHPLYQIVERAVAMGVLNPVEENFEPDTPISRQEVAAWYIRILGFEQAGKHANIYKLNFSDASKVKKEYTGYVALANELGLLTTEKNQFYPQREVTYAELAVSVMVLAHTIYENGNYMYYY